MPDDDVVITLTPQEFDRVCSAVSAVADLFKSCADNSPNDEDALIDLEEHLAYVALQEKFPDPGMIRLRDPEEGDA